MELSVTHAEKRAKKILHWREEEGTEIGFFQNTKGRGNRGEKRA